MSTVLTDPLLNDSVLFDHLQFGRQAPQPGVLGSRLTPEGFVTPDSPSDPVGDAVSRVVAGPAGGPSTADQLGAVQAVLRGLQGFAGGLPAGGG